MLVLARKILLDVAFQASKKERAKELMKFRDPFLVLLVLVFTKFDGLLQRGWSRGVSISAQDNFHYLPESNPSNSLNPAKSIPDMINCNNANNSVRLFCSGVPVKSSLLKLLITANVIHR